MVMVVVVMDEIIITKTHSNSLRTRIRHSHIIFYMKILIHTHVRRSRYYLKSVSVLALPLYRHLYDVFVCVNCVTEPSLYKVLYICFYWYAHHTTKKKKVVIKCVALVVKHHCAALPLPRSTSVQNIYSFIT